MPKYTPPNKETARNEQIRRWRRQRYQVGDIARKVGVSRQRISAICKGVRPKGLTRDY